MDVIVSFSACLTKAISSQSITPSFDTYVCTGMFKLPQIHSIQARPLPSDPEHFVTALKNNMSEQSALIINLKQQLEEIARGTGRELQDLSAASSHAHLRMFSRIVLFWFRSALVSALLTVVASAVDLQLQLSPVLSPSLLHYQSLVVYQTRWSSLTRRFKKIDCLILRIARSRHHCTRSGATTRQ